jgi:hypothetical protein
MILLHHNVINIHPKHASVEARALVGNTLFAVDEDGNDVQLGTIKSNYFGPVLDQSGLQLVNEAEKKDQGTLRQVTAIDMVREWYPKVFPHVRLRSTDKHMVDREPLKGLALVKAKLKGEPTYVEKRWVAKGPEEAYYDGHPAYDIIVDQKTIALHEALVKWLVANLTPEWYERDFKPLNPMDDEEVKRAAEALAAYKRGPEISFSKATEEQASVVGAFFSQQVEADKLEKMLSSAFGVKVKVKPLSGLGYDIGEQTLEELITTLHREE